MVFCLLYSIITTISTIKHLKLGSGADAIISICYMATLVWLAVSFFTGVAAHGAMWFIAIINMIILLLIIIGGAQLKTLNKPAVITAIIYKLLVITFAIGLAV